MPATATRPKRQIVSLREYSAVGLNQVDKAKGVIYRAKVVGVHSRNGREYPLTTLEAALNLYEGAPVYVDHGDEGRRGRNVADKLGTLRRVRAGADGLYADLCCLVSHPLWPRLAEAAETQPHLFGLSHVAEGETSRQNGRTIITKITAVHSVDVVSDAAAVHGLFEAIYDPAVDDVVQAYLAGRVDSTNEQLAAALSRIAESDMTDEQKYEWIRKLSDVMLKVGKAKAELADPDATPLRPTDAGLSLAEAVTGARPTDPDSLEAFCDRIRPKLGLRSQMIARNLPDLSLREAAPAHYTPAATLTEFCDRIR